MEHLAKVQLYLSQKSWRKLGHICLLRMRKTFQKTSPFTNPYYWWTLRAALRVDSALNYINTKDSVGKTLSDVAATHPRLFLNWSVIVGLTSTITNLLDGVIFQNGRTLADPSVKLLQRLAIVAEPHETFEAEKSKLPQIVLYAINLCGKETVHAKLLELWPAEVKEALADPAWNESHSAFMRWAFQQSLHVREDRRLLPRTTLDIFPRILDDRALPS